MNAVAVPAACGERHAACNRARSRMTASPPLAVEPLGYGFAAAPSLTWGPAEAGSVSATQHFRHRLLAEHLHAVAAPRAEREEMPRQRVVSEDLAHDRRQGVEAPGQVTGTEAPSQILLRTRF